MGTVGTILREQLLGCSHFQEMFPPWWEQIGFFAVFKEKSGFTTKYPVGES